MRVRKYLVSTYAPEKTEQRNTEEYSQNNQKCEKCDKTFDSKKDLKRHILENHPMRINCKICKNIFSKTSDLEKHISSIHEEKENYKCNHCEKSFVLNWRLMKHQNVHSSTNIKNCHYHNNKKTCPYDEIGCMFQHSMSP